MTSPSETSRLLRDAALPAPAPTTCKPSALAAAAGGELTGYGCITAGTLFIAANYTLLRLAETAYAIPPATSLFLRSITILSICSTVLLRFKHTLPRLHSRRTISLLIGAGCSNAMSFASLYAAMPHIDIGDATAIHFAAPLVTLPLAAITLAEPCTLFDVGAALLSVVGAAVLSRGGSTVHVAGVRDERIAGVVLAGFSAVFCAVGGVLTRAMNSSVHFLHVVLASATACGVISIMTGGPAVLWYASEATWKGVAIVLVGSVLAFVAQSLVNAGLLRCSAGGGSLMLNLVVPMTYVFALIFLHERPSGMHVVGAAMVVASVGMIGVRRIVRDFDACRRAPRRGEN